MWWIEKSAVASIIKSKILKPSVSSLGLIAKEFVGIYNGCGGDKFCTYKVLKYLGGFLVIIIDATGIEI